ARALLGFLGIRLRGQSEQREARIRVDLARAERALHAASLARLQAIHDSPRIIAVQITHEEPELVEVEDGHALILLVEVVAEGSLVEAVSVERGSAGCLSAEARECATEDGQYAGSRLVLSPSDDR